MPELVPATNTPERLVAELRQLISEARLQAAVTVNLALTHLYWRIGDRIRREVVGSERAEYGEQIVATLSHQFVRLKLGQHFDEHLAELIQAVPGESKSISEDISGDSIRKKRAYLKRRYPELYADTLQRAKTAVERRVRH
jgi:hypothetical protein